MSPAAEGLALLIANFERMGIPYYLAGSLASSLHGIFRYTSDVDLVATIPPEQADALTEALQQDFYADAEMIRSAIRRGRSFNVIHFKSSYKFDIFPALNEPFHQSQMARRTQVDLSGIGLKGTAQAATAEDTILSKLAWYRAGGATSEQQWKDVLGIAKVQGSLLDLEYLRRWARHLKVEDLLDELLA